MRLPVLLMNSFRTRDDSLAALARYRRPRRRRTPARPRPAPRAQAARRRPRRRALAGRSRAGVVPARARRPVSHAARHAACSTRSSIRAIASPSAPTPTTSAPPSTRASPGGWRPSRCRSSWRPRRALLPTAREGTSPGGRADGRLILREIAQTADGDLDAFQDVDRHRYFNTNNVWLDLRALRDVLDASDGVLDLPLIRNAKTVDPQDPSSPAVIQIESAMGAAIQVFEGSRAVLVDRERFVPVKTTNDLLVLRSDAYVLDERGELAAAARRAGAPDPVVDLDPAPLQDDARLRAPLPRRPALAGRLPSPDRPRRRDVRRRCRRSRRRRRSTRPTSATTCPPAPCSSAERRPTPAPVRPCWRPRRAQR